MENLDAKNEAVSLEENDNDTKSKNTQQKPTNLPKMKKKKHETADSHEGLVEMKSVQAKVYLWIKLLLKK